MQDLENILQQKFGLPSFREGQKEIIKSVLDIKDTLVFMPTWGWKSLTYQFPWVILEWLVLVISPLISLMKDQVDKLNELSLKANFINSTIDNYDRQIILNDISKDDWSIKFLYIAPERLNSEDFLRVISRVKIALVAIDEAHCISQWGHDFRPSYMKIRGFLEELKKVKNFPIIALTATATKKVRADIIDRLGLQNPNIFTTWFERKNIWIIVREISKREEKQAKLLEILEKTPGNGIIYCASVKSCQEVFTFLQEKNISSWIYTWEMNSENREKTQNNFMNSEYKVIVATNAFWMWIDKKDIRFVIHYNLPGSIENYYQEVWRAGRDWKNSFWVVLASFWDTKIQEFFIDNSYPSKEEIVQFYNYLYKDFKLAEWKNTNILKTYFIMASESWIKNDLRVWSILRVLEKYWIVKRWVENFENFWNFRWKWIILMKDKVGENSIPVDWHHQDMLKEEAYYKLEQIKKLLFYPHCRKRFILEYFWDEEDVRKIWDNCWTCDFCIEKNKIWDKIEEDLVKNSVFSLVLETVKKFDERFWVWMITKFLWGSEDKKILEYWLDNYENFWALADFSTEMIKNIIEALIFQEFLYKTDWKYPMLWISEKWRVAIVRNYLLSNENKELQFFIRKKIWEKNIFKSKVWQNSVEKPKREKWETFIETLKIFRELANQKNNLDEILIEISEKRWLAKTTVWWHLAEVYVNWQMELFEILKFLDLEKIKIIKKVILEEVWIDLEKLKTIKEKLESIWRNDINYFEIKMAISMMEKKDI